MVLLKEDIERTRADRELLMLEYKELLEEILHRRQNMWLIHSILLASALIISFRPDPELLPLPYWVSLFLIVSSRFFERANEHVNKSCYKRREKIADKLGMKGPRDRFEQLRKSWIYKIRGYAWNLFFVVLIMVYVYLLLPYLPDLRA